MKVPLRRSKTTTAPLAVPQYISVLAIVKTVNFPLTSFFFSSYMIPPYMSNAGWLTEF